MAKAKIGSSIIRHSPFFLQGNLGKAVDVQAIIPQL
jgi:hypothetical protein